MLKGGTTRFGVILHSSLSLSHIEGGEGGGAESVHSLKGGHKMFYPVMRGGGAKVSDSRFSYFVAPLPIIIDQTLMRSRSEQV